MKKSILACAAAATLLVGVLSPSTTANADATGSGGEFVSVPYSRLASGAPFASQEERDYKVLGTPGIPDSGVSAVLLDVSAVSATSTDSWVKIWPKGSERPVVSALRFGTDNVPRTSTIAVIPGADGSISVSNGPGTSDFNIDVQGYFTAVAPGTQPQPGGFVPVVPERILSTVDGLGAPAAKVGPGQILRVQVSGLANVPEDASAVFANLRVRDVDADGTLRVVPSGDDPTLAKPLMHYSVGGSDDIGASFKLGSGGAVMMYNSGSQPIHLDFDVQGYFSGNPTVGGGFHPVPLTRIWDSTLAAGKEIRVPVGGANGLPTYGIGGAMLGIIAEDYSSTGNLSLFQAGKPATGLGNVTFHGSEGGLPNTGTAVIRPGDHGEVVVHNSSAGPVDVRVSLMGWFPAQRVVSEADEADFRSDATDLGADEDWISQAIYDASMLDESLTIAEGLGDYLLPDPEASSRLSSASDPVCEELRAQNNEPGPCEAMQIATVDDETTATAEELQEHGDSIADDGTTLAMAARTTTIYTRTWSQTKRSITYFAWAERHSGRIFFDRNGRVWSTKAQSGLTGYHKCDLGSGTGYTIKVTDCSTERRYDLRKRPISEWDRFQVHFLAKGIPIYKSHNMHVNAYPSGAVTAH